MSTEFSVNPVFQRVLLKTGYFTPDMQRLFQDIAKKIKDLESGGSAIIITTATQTNITGILTGDGANVGFITDNSANWNEAYSWGDHALAGYVTNAAGSDTQIQFNDSGDFAGDTDLTWNKTTNTMTINGGTLNMVNGVIQNVECIDYNLTPTAGTQEGRRKWDADAGTTVLGMPGGNVQLQDGQELLAPRAKAIGSDIDNGQLVYITGATGNVPEMTLAKADTPANSRGTIAMATEDITQNQLGYFTKIGLVRDIDTGSYTEGDILYLDASTAGAYTDTEPAPPNIVVRIGTVIRAHATEGSIDINIKQRSNNAKHIRGLIAGQLVFADSNGHLTTDVTSRYTGTQTLDADDHIVFCNTDAGSFTVTMPSSPGLGEYKRIINTGSNVLTINGNGNDIKGAATQVLAFGEDLETTFETTDGWW